MSRRRCGNLLRRLACAAALAGSVVPAAGCTKHALVDAAMTLAKRPRVPADRKMLGYELLAGDFHCHVSPPDSERHVARGVAETLELAEVEGLDFVVLTPHVRARFFRAEETRLEVLEERAALMAEVNARLARRRAERPRAWPLIVLPGMEYTDFEYGHLTLSFGDLAAALDRVSSEATIDEPARFFEAFVATGGVVTINHPFLTPVASPLSITSRDLSFRPWTEPGSPASAEIEAAARLAQTVEAHNLAVSDLRDKLLLGETKLSVHAALGAMEDRIRGGRRRMAPVGGSDSHSSHLRATTFALAEARTEAALRAAVLEGRTCVRSPAACAFEARGDDGVFRPVGSSLRAKGRLEVRAGASGGDVVADGRVVAQPSRGEIATLDVPARCSLVRLDVDGGSSAPIYVNCPFADRAPGAR